jgi:hypothetical protein
MKFFTFLRVQLTISSFQITDELSCQLHYRNLGGDSYQKILTGQLHRKTNFKLQGLDGIYCHHRALAPPSGLNKRTEEQRNFCLFQYL